MQKKCQKCNTMLDASSFNSSKKEPDGLSKTCRACVNKRRRELQQQNKSTPQPTRLKQFVKKGDFYSYKKVFSPLNDEQVNFLLSLAVRDFNTAPKKPGHLEIIRHLLKQGATPSSGALSESTIGPHPEIMELLLDAGAKIDIFSATAMGDVKRVKRFLKRQPNLVLSTCDTELYFHKPLSPLTLACRSELGKVDEAYYQSLLKTVEILLTKGATVKRDALDECANRGGNLEIAKLLISHDIQPTGNTLLCALGHSQRHGRGNYAIAELCLSHGVDINATDGDRTALHAFAHQGDSVGTSWLLEHGAKVDVPDEGGNTPFHKACERNTTLKVVELLLEQGANQKSKNKNGETPLDVARKNDKQKIIDYLNG